MLWKVFFMAAYCLVVIVWSINAVTAVSHWKKLTMLRRIKKNLKRKEDEK